MIKLEDWPPVPRKKRPKKLFVDSNLSFETIEKFREIGWEIVDIRLLPASSDSERAESLKAQLEGVRIGSIRPDLARLKFLELEARIYGLHNTKQPSEKKGDEEEEMSAKELLSGLGSTRAFKGTYKGGNFRANMVEDGSEVQKEPDERPPGSSVGDDQ